MARFQPVDLFSRFGRGKMLLVATSASRTKLPQICAACRYLPSVHVVKGRAYFMHKRRRVIGLRGRVCFSMSESLKAFLWKRAAGSTGITLFICWACGVIVPAE